jgi:glucosamine kinase
LATNQAGNFKDNQKHFLTREAKIAMLVYWLGVDGGGSGTRVILANAAGAVLARASAGPSALGQGARAAWQNILTAVRQAFASAHVEVPPWSQCALGAGLSGVSHAPLVAEFMALNPGFLHLVLESDAYIALLAAHDGQPGVMVAAGTGSIGEALYSDGHRRQVGGWGFPVGDEGSGAWLGLRAMAHAQQTMDGRMPGGILAARIQQQCGADTAQLRQWCARARQFEYAQLAVAVFESAADDQVAEQLLVEAATAIERILIALDPSTDLPLAIYGSVGRALLPRLTPITRDRCIATPRDAPHGALTLIRQWLSKNP